MSVNRNLAEVAGSAKNKNADAVGNTNPTDIIQKQHLDAALSADGHNHDGQYVSAPAVLDNLSDVTVAGATDGQVIVYRTGQGWVLENLADVFSSGPAPVVVPIAHTGGYDSGTFYEDTRGTINAKSSTKGANLQLQYANENTEIFIGNLTFTPDEQDAPVQCGGVFYFYEPSGNWNVDFSTYPETLLPYPPPTPNVSNGRFANGKFGRDVDVSKDGNTLITCYGPTTTSAANQCGAGFFIYERATLGAGNSDYTMVQYIPDPAIADTGIHNHGAKGLAISGDGNTIIFKGGNSSAVAELNSAYVYFRKSDGTWSETPDQTLEMVTPASFTTAPTYAEYIDLDYFGDTALLSVTNGVGEARIYNKVNGSFDVNNQQTIPAPTPAGTTASRQFSRGGCFSADGTVVWISAPLWDDSPETGGFTGRTYRFIRGSKTEVFPSTPESFIDFPAAPTGGVWGACINGTPSLDKLIISGKKENGLDVGFWQLSAV